jgi:hypothetical protein
VLVISLWFWSAEAVAQTRADDERSTEASAVTHVELDSLGRFFKIEVAESEPPMYPNEILEEERLRTTLYLNFLGLLDLDARGYAEPGQPAFFRAGVLKWPLFTVYSVNEEVTSQQAHAAYASINLFALFDAVVEKGGEGIGFEGEPRYARVVFLDSFLFTVYRTVIRAPDAFEWEILDPPLMTTLLHRVEKDRNVWKFLNIPFLWVFRYDRYGDHKETHLIDGPGVALFHREQREGESDSWSFGDLLVLDVTKGSRQGEESHFGVLESFKLGKGPFLSVYTSDVKMKTKAGGTEAVSSSQFARLPLIGAVAGTWKDGEGGHFALFPRLFVSKKRRPEAF